MNPQIQIVPNAEELAREAAGQFVRLVLDGTQSNGIFTVALSGGSTPKALYSLLATRTQSEVPWGKIHFFWGDERYVPPDHAESNYRMVNEVLLSKVPIPPGNVHRIKCENTDPDKAADEYEQTMREFFHLSSGQLPRFDLVLLGLGDDGHTASLFPGTKALNENRRLVVSNWVGKLDAHRITMTAQVFNHAAVVIFLVSGEGKAAPLKAVLEGDYEPAQLPAQLIRPTQGTLLWIVDKSAASLLRSSDS